jgi:hypothetical protein
MATVTLRPRSGYTSGGSPPGPEKQIDPDYEIAADELQATFNVYRLVTDLTVLEPGKLFF